MRPIEIFANGQIVATLRLDAGIGRPHLSRIHADARFFGNEQFRLKSAADGWIISPVPGTVNPTLVDNAPLLGPRLVSSSMTVKVRGAAGLILELRVASQPVPANISNPHPAYAEHLPHYAGLPYPPFDSSARYYCGKCLKTSDAPIATRGVFFCGACASLMFLLEESVSKQLLYPWQFLGKSEWLHSRTSKLACNSKERAEEIWMTVAKQVKYELDEKLFSGRPEVWQTAAETLSCGHGDCEDHAILLGDWLAKDGYEVRLAVGDTRSNSDGWGGHAWVVLRLAGIEYLIEATKKVTVHSSRGSDPLRVEEAWRTNYRFETVSQCGSNYRPDFMFNHQRFWSRKGRLANGKIAELPPPSSYWSDSEWTEGVWLRQH